MISPVSMLMKSCDSVAGNGSEPDLNGFKGNSLQPNLEDVRLLIDTLRSGYGYFRTRSITLMTSAVTLNAE